MDVVFAYLAGLLTLINPCVLPVLPIVLASALQVSSLGPVVLATGMGLSFVAVGMAVLSFGQLIGINNDDVAQLGALVMVGFGFVTLLPKLSSGFSRLLTAPVGLADHKLGQIDRHTIVGQFIGGGLLGIVWSPCVGPTLGGAIALASQGENLIWAGSNGAESVHPSLWSHAPLSGLWVILNLSHPVELTPLPPHLQESLNNER